MRIDSILGVDPGLSGAFVLVGISYTMFARRFHIMDAARIPVRTESLASGTIRKHVDEVEAVRAFRYFHSSGCYHAAIEKVGGITGQSASAAFNFGAGYGTLITAAHASGMAVELVRPQEWRSVFDVGPRINLKTVKCESVAKANDIIGHEAFSYDADGSAKADAALIAMSQALKLIGATAKLPERADKPAKRKPIAAPRKVAKQSGALAKKRTVNGLKKLAARKQKTK